MVDKMASAIAKATAVVVCFSKQYEKSKYCHYGKCIGDQLDTESSWGRVSDNPVFGVERSGRSTQYNNGDLKVGSLFFTVV